MGLYSQASKKKNNKLKYEKIIAGLSKNFIIFFLNILIRCLLF